MARQIIGVCDEALSKLPALDDKLRSQATDYSDLKVGHVMQQNVAALNIHSLVSVCSYICSYIGALTMAPMTTLRICH